MSLSDEKCVSAKMKGRRRRRGEMDSWLEIYFLRCTCLQLFWPAIVMKKWLNIKPREDEFSADEKDTESDFDEEDAKSVEREPASPTSPATPASNNVSHQSVSRFQATGIPSERFLRRLRRGKSETMRAQYIDTKEIKILVGTWNVGGNVPPNDLDIEDWLGKQEQADMYVLGFQEIVPLNAGNIFGAEDNSPVSKWEAIIRRTLNRTRQAKSKCKCYSAPTSPSRVKTSDASDTIADEMLSPENDVASNEDVSLLPESIGKDTIRDWLDSSNLYSFRRVSSFSGIAGSTWPEELIDSAVQDLKSSVNLKRSYSSSGRIGMKWLEPLSDSEMRALSPGSKLRRMCTISEIGLSWPEQPLDSETQDLLSNVSSLKKSDFNEEPRNCLETLSSSDADVSPTKPKRVRERYVRIVSKQMVGIFVSVWVLRTLRRHINNLKVSPIGVGVMGYIGNKGSISVSMSIYQTSFCFVCSHLTSGEKEGDESRRNSDVLEILRRTHFPPVAGVELPQTILEHDRVIWFGDLNYRLNLSNSKTQELVAMEDWEALMDSDQLIKQLRKGRVFDGWSEGFIEFGPTYKYMINSDKYFGENAKAGEKRRTPAWCDRILFIGKGIKQLSYTRVEQMLSDHRPVNAVFLAEVEIFSRRKLQRALTFTDAELEVQEFPSETEIGI